MERLRVADEALRLLLDRFWSVEAAAALYEHPRVLWALCRLGGRFCEALLDPLGRSGTGRQALAAAAFEAVSRCLDPRWLSGATPRQWADQVRVRLKWPALRSADRLTGRYGDARRQSASEEGSNGPRSESRPRKPNRRRAQLSFVGCQGCRKTLGAWAS